MVSIPACHAGDRGSIPRQGEPLRKSQCALTLDDQSRPILDSFYLDLNSVLKSMKTLYVSINNGDKEVASVKSLNTLHTFPLVFSNPSAGTKELENPGIDPGASRMRSERSPI